MKKKNPDATSEELQAAWKQVTPEEKENLKQRALEGREQFHARKGKEDLTNISHHHNNFLSHHNKKSQAREESQP